VNTTILPTNGSKKTRQLVISAGDYSVAVKNYNSTWAKTDEVLYNLCRDNFDHSNRAAVYAKVYIIGRTYATGIERSVPSRGTQGSSLSQVAELFYAMRNQLDIIISGLRSISEPLTPQSLMKIIELHAQLVDLITPITRNGRSPRSFASKYLHFHNSAVPIFDLLASQELVKTVRWSLDLQIVQPSQMDQEYFKHTMRFLRLYNCIADQKLTPFSVRMVDAYLLRNA